MQESFILKQSGASPKKAAEALSARLSWGTALFLICSGSYGCITISQWENYSLQHLCSSPVLPALSPSLPRLHFFSLLPLCRVSFSFPLAIPSLCAN